MTEKLILEKLDQMEKKVDKIETAVSLIAVQTERINHLSAEVATLKVQHESAFSPHGVINEVKNWQAGCPRERINDALNRQWMIIAFLGLMNTGTFLKALGVF